MFIQDRPRCQLHRMRKPKPQAGQVSRANVQVRLILDRTVARKSFCMESVLLESPVLRCCKNAKFENVPAILCQTLFVNCKNAQFQSIYVFLCAVKMHNIISFHYLIFVCCKNAEWKVIYRKYIIKSAILPFRFGSDNQVSML